MKTPGRSVWQNSKTGKWMYQVRIPQYGGKPIVKMRTAPTEAEAWELAHELYTKIKKTGFSQNPVRLRELIQNYLSVKHSYLRPSTLANNKYLLEHYVLGKLGDRIVANLRTADLPISLQPI